MAHKETYDLAAAAEAADFIRRQARTMPRAAVLTGTGLGHMAKAVEIKTTIAYQDIPHFPIPTMETHRGRLVLGNMAGQPVALLQGRFHLYEGCAPMGRFFRGACAGLLLVGPWIAERLGRWPGMRRAPGGHFSHSRHAGSGD